MERIFLCLLCLSGWSVSSFLPRQYHYVAESMTWTEAQTYCRKKYNDLATVENVDETNQLKSSVPSDHHSGYVWIGLYSKIQWKWSDGYTGSGLEYRNWENINDNEPDFSSGVQLCVQLDEFGAWWDETCDTKWTSLCYRGTQQDPDYVFISDKRTWSEAQRYCRENYADLATVRNRTETQKIQGILPSIDYAWIGMYRDPDLSWSDGRGSSFQNWKGGPNPIGTSSVVCGVSDTDSGKWIPKLCEERHPFVCNGPEKKKYTQVIKLSVKPEDPSVDLNHPAVKVGLLRELQDRLKESGLSGVTLKWREQPDGKVFHKEEESSQEKDREKCEL